MPANSIPAKPLTVDREPNSAPVDQSHLIDLDVSSFSTSMIIMSILAVPLLVIIIVISIIRLRQRGKT